ncbi:MAG: TIGR03915 family putative DNA repair protein [Syntrophobacteraceae bacterium]
MDSSDLAPSDAIRGVSKARSTGSVAMKPRTVFLHDGTFEGLLTTVFETYERRVLPDAIERKGSYQAGLFDRCVVVETDMSKADRVWRRLKDMVGRRHARILFSAFLSGDRDADSAICRTVRSAVERERGGSEEHLRTHLRELDTISLKVRREAHRMHGFVRFERVEDDLYVGLIAPRHNVLPLILDHFERRYGDQKWVIYDTSRDYGYYFDADETSEVRLPREMLDGFSKGKGSRESYAALWKQYFDAVDIPERRNMALHLQKVPRRYWRYLPEKRLPSPHGGKSP